MRDKMSGDIRVTRDEGQDATMEEIGEKGRPPGEPPDKPGSWVETVKGSNRGGMRIPEDVLDDAFVTARMKLDFPDGDEGEPVVTIGSEVLAVMNGLWEKCMIVKVLGRHMSIPVLSKRLRELWKPSSEMYVMDLPRQFFMIRFESEDEYMAALTGGPWKVFGSYLTVQAWSPEFDPVKDDILTTPVWVRLSNLPVNFYHSSILMGIAKGLGKPLKVDTTTSNLERARFARVCVEVNLKKPLKGTVMVNGVRYYVAYEGLPNICSGCGVYGHMIHACPKIAANRARGEKPLVTEITGGMGEPTPVDEGFIQVKQRRRRTEANRNTPVRRGGDENGKMEMNNRDSRGKDTRDIPVSNSFGRLEEDLESLQTQERNKESGNSFNNSGQGNRERQGKGIIFGADTGKKENGNNDGSQQRKNGKLKGSDKGRPKQFNGPRPTRGLIFGPTNKEVALSSNGKRMRVEDVTLERAGVCEVKSVTGIEEVTSEGTGSGAVVMDTGAGTEVQLRQREMVLSENRDASHDSVENSLGIGIA